jgi:hypothetical protein
MSFDGVRHTFECRLIWRHGDFAGIVSGEGERSTFADLTRIISTDVRPVDHVLPPLEKSRDQSAGADRKGGEYGKIGEHIKSGSTKTRSSRLRGRPRQDNAAINLNQHP